MAKKQNKHHNRWWTTIDDVRVIRRYPIDVDPNTLPDNTHHWTRGVGPHTPEQYERNRVAMQLFAGRPKTQQHRAAMSAASSGVPKSAQHVESMRRTHQLRVQRVRQLMSEQPHLSYHQASTIEAQLRKKK